MPRRPLRSCTRYPTLNSSGVAFRAQRLPEMSVRLATETASIPAQDCIIEATAEGYDFYDPFVGRFARHTLTQYFALLRARFSVGRVIRWPELAFNLRGPMQSTTSEARHQYWREAPMLGLTGASSIAMTHAGVVSETVTYDLNIACDWLRR